MLCKWWAVTVSNRRHSRCKRDALPTELTALLICFIRNFKQNNNKELYYFLTNKI